MRIISWITVCDLSLLPVSECPEMAKSLVELVVPTSDGSRHLVQRGCACRGLEIKTGKIKEN